MAPVAGTRFTTARSVRRCMLRACSSARWSRVDGARRQDDLNRPIVAQAPFRLTHGTLHQNWTIVTTLQFAEGSRMTTAMRTERDTFGPIEVPADRLWGAQTQRSLEHFAISGER